MSSIIAAIHPLVNDETRSNQIIDNIMWEIKIWKLDCVDDGPAMYQTTHEKKKWTCTFKCITLYHKYLVIARKVFYLKK